METHRKTRSGTSFLKRSDGNRLSKVFWGCDRPTADDGGKRRGAPLGRSPLRAPPRARPSPSGARSLTLIIPTNTQCGLIEIG